jgi:hypothetical protein
LTIAADRYLTVAPYGKDGRPIDTIWIMIRHADVMGPKAALSSATSPPPGARMSRVVDLGQMLKIQMCIDLGRADVGVSQEFLDAAQIGARFQQVARERVTEHVGVHVHA